MTQGSSQKFIARNRAPRVQIEYDVELFGSEKKVQLPFVMGVMSDLAGRSTVEQPAIEDRKFLEIDVQNGRLRNQIGEIDGVPVVSAFQMKDGDSTGFINAVAASNDRGRATIIYRPHFLVGYRRRVQTWFKYYEESDAYQMGGWARIGMIRRDTSREANAMLKNIGI